LTDLFELDPESFDEKTHCALVYVRSLLTDPDGVPADVEERFYALCEPREREYVLAAMKGMLCTNLLVNTWRGMLPSGNDSCRLP